MIPGIDVSHYNGVIDWKQVAESGVKFAYIKCTDGAMWSDPMWGKNCFDARKAGIKIGSYHFLRSGATADQITIFLGLQRADDIPDDLPPCLDVELPGSLPVLECAQRIMDELKRVPVIYTNLATAESLNPDEMSAYPLWIAEYAGGAQPHLPQAWPVWTFWQHTDKGIVPGIPGIAGPSNWRSGYRVDLDWFNGDAADFEKFLADSTVTFSDSTDPASPPDSSPAS